MTTEQEAQRHCEHGMPSDMGCDDCIISKLVAEREADRAAMREALEALNAHHTEHTSDPERQFARGVYDLAAIEAAITNLRQRLGDDAPTSALAR